MPRQRHWRNYPEGGGCAFVTTTCLDFVHAFAEPAARDLMALSLLHDLGRTGAIVSTYVAMPHHIHFLVALPEGRDVTSVVNAVKSGSAKRVMRILSPEMLAQFDQQRGLNGRSFWQRSFRSVSVVSEPVFWQKVRYIHENPVRAGLCAEAEDYRWSSAADWAAGLWDSDTGLDISRARARFSASEPLLPLGRSSLNPQAS